jgi:hypothetical protein
MGRDVERGLGTGRLAKNIMKDGMEGYVPRGLWRPVVRLRSREGNRGVV